MLDCDGSDAAFCNALFFCKDQLSVRFAYMPSFHLENLERGALQKPWFPDLLFTFIIELDSLVAFVSEATQLLLALLSLLCLLNIFNIEWDIVSSFRKHSLICLWKNCELYRDCYNLGYLLCGANLLIYYNVHTVLTTMMK